MTITPVKKTHSVSILQADYDYSDYCGDVQACQIQENLVKNKFEIRIVRKKINITENDENEVELANNLSNEDNKCVPIKKKRLIVLNYSSDSNIE